MAWCKADRVAALSATERCNDVRTARQPVGHHLYDANRDVRHIGEGNHPAAGSGAGGHTAGNAGAHAVARARIGDNRKARLRQ